MKKGHENMPLKSIEKGIGRTTQTEMEKKVGKRNPRPENPEMSKPIIAHQRARGGAGKIIK